MKRTILPALFIYSFTALAIAQNSSFTTVITAYKKSDMRAPHIILGFSESSFDYSSNPEETPDNKAICYAGSINNVCLEIRKAAEFMQKKFQEGEHDTMNLKSCLIKDTAVAVSYRLTDDYGGDISIDRQITQCGLSEARQP